MSVSGPSIIATATCGVATWPTSAFTPASDCTSWTKATYPGLLQFYYQLADIYSTTYGSLEFAGGVPAVAVTKRSCIPPVSRTEEVIGPCAFVYGSGSACLPGWTSAATAVRRNQTTGYCCPIGPSSIKLRLGTLNSDEYFPTMVCVGNTLAYERVPWTYVSNETTITTTMGSEVFTAIPMTFLDVTTFASSTTSTAMTGASISPPPSETGPVSNTRSQKDLSSGAIAGIGVGSTIVGLAVLAGVIMYWLRRRRTKSVNNVPEENRPAVELEAHKYMPEMSTQTRMAELETERSMGELDAGTRGAELEHHGNAR